MSQTIFVHDDMKISICCDSIKGGVKVCYTENGTVFNQIVDDITLCRYIRKDMYCAFHYAAKQLREIIHETDFDFDIVCSEPQKECLLKIKECIPAGKTVVEYWRQLKKTIAICNCIIYNYDWAKHPGTSLAQNSHNVRDYIERALQEICDNGFNEVYRKIAIHYKYQIANFSKLIECEKIVISYGLVAPKCEVGKTLDFDITWGPALFCCLLLIVLILLILVWFKSYSNA